jgi:hypothetical protein
MALDSSPMSVETVEEGEYDVATFADELAAAPGTWRWARLACSRTIACACGRCG